MIDPDGGKRGDVEVSLAKGEMFPGAVEAEDVGVFFRFLDGEPLCF